MPFKHQTESYRTRKGVRFECDGDILDTAQGDLRIQAENRVAVLKIEGWQAFFEKQGDYFRVFRGRGPSTP